MSPTTHSTPSRVLIVGAGPAGTTTAIALKRFAPMIVPLIVDRSPFPRDKPCGDGLGPGARRTLEELGLTHLLAGFNKPDSVALAGPDLVEARLSGPFVGGKDLSGFVAPRRDFDNRLLEEARRLGVEIRTECRFRTLRELKDGGVEVDLTDVRKGTVSVERFDFVIGADGAYSEVRRAVGLPVAPKSKTHIAIRSYADISHPELSVDDTLRLDFLEGLLPAYGWVFPLVGGRANIGVGVPIERLSSTGRSLVDNLQVYYENLRNRGFIVGNPESVKAHQLPHAAAKLPMSKGLVLTIGDAAATINPFSGEGIFYGMAAGLQLAQQLGVASAEPNAELNFRNELKIFEGAYTQRFKKHFRNSYIAHQMLRSKKWASLTIKAAARDREVMSDGAFMMFDEQSISLAAIGKAAIRGIRK